MKNGNETRDVLGDSRKRYRARKQRQSLSKYLVPTKGEPLQPGQMDRKILYIWHTVDRMFDTR